MTKASWDDLVRVVRSLTNTGTELPVRGTFTINTKTDLAVLKKCLEASYDTHLHLVNEEEPYSLEVGQSVVVSIDLRLGFGQIKRNIGELLSGTRKARIKEPKFFLMNEGLSSSDFIADDHLVTRYRTVLNFIQTLKNSAAFLDPEEPSLVFIKEGKFELFIEYNTPDLEKISLPAIREVINIIPSGIHEKQCASILAEAVISLTEHLATEKRFAYLLAHAGELKKKFEQSYQLFAAGFSYEKIKDQVEAAKVEYSGKIHKVFSDIQNQLLGIPVATIVVATQMKDAKTYGYEFWINTAVLLGCWVFAVLVILLIRNQSHTLSVLSKEISRQKNQITKEFASVASSLTDVFDYLSKRVLAQRVTLWSISAALIMGLILSHAIYFTLTPPAWNWIVNYVLWLARCFQH